MRQDFRSSGLYNEPHTLTMAEPPSQDDQAEQPSTFTDPTNMDLCIGKSSDESQTHGTPNGRNAAQLLQARDDHSATNRSAEPTSKNDDTELHSETLIMENHNLENQIEKLSQQVEDLQLHASNISATKKKRVHFSDDSVSAVQLLRDAIPSMSASELYKLGKDLHNLGSDILLELAKRQPSGQTSSTTPNGDVQPSSKSTNNVHMTRPVSPTSSHTPKTPSPARDNDQPGTKTKTSSYMKGTTAADARSRSRPDSAVDNLVKRPDTRTPARFSALATSGRPAPGTREQPHTDRGRLPLTMLEDLPHSPFFNSAAGKSKKGRSVPETEQSHTDGRRRPAHRGIEDIAPTRFTRGVAAAASKKGRSIPETG